MVRSKRKRTHTTKTNLIGRAGMVVLVLVVGAALTVSAANNGETYSWLEPGRLIQAQSALTQFQTAHPGVRAARTNGQLITRLYGHKFGSGATPQATAEAFRQNESAIFGVSSDELAAGKVNEPTQVTQPVMYDRTTGTYKFTLVYYHQVRDGVPVLDAELRLLVRNEPGYPIVEAISSLRDLGAAFAPDKAKAAGSQQLVRNAALQSEPALKDFGQQKTVVWAGRNDDLVQPRTAVRFWAASVDGKWFFIIDAETGEIISKKNALIDVDVTGSVSGNASQGQASEQCTDELPEALENATVNIGGTTAYTDENGNFTIPNSGSGDVVVQSQLAGQWFHVYNFTGADVLLADTVTPPGPADFLHNAANNTEQIRAQVNAYYQANLERDFVLTYNPTYPTLQNPDFPIYTNRVDGYCPGNAWYDQIDVSLNFCLSGSGYPNTAWSSVLHHEYGHHLVEAAGSGQDQYGEGMGDCMSLIIADDPRLGLGFFGDCVNPLRNADNNIMYPCSGEAHDCAGLLSGCVWETRNALAADYPADYREILANLTINSILLHTGSQITPQITIDFLTLDDDDGNLDNGSPHYSEIAEGFAAHNMPAPELQPLTFQYPNGRPAFLLPDTTTTVLVNVVGNAVNPVATSGQAYYSIDGGAYQAAAMNEVSANHYEITLPQVICGNIVKWYMSADGESFGTVTDPLNAPTDIYTAVAATASTVTLQDNFQTDMGWTVGGSVSSGAWERAVPTGGGSRGDPPTDYDGSGACYVTQNGAGDTDVDGGTTILYSPTIDLTDASDAMISYARWYSNTGGGDPNNDEMNIYVSNDDGSTWALVETVGPVNDANGGWYTHSFFVSNYVTPTATVKVRFDASDLGTGSVVEAGVDAFEVVKFDCNTTDLAIITFDVPDWTVGVPYSAQLSYINGVGQVSFSDLNGDLVGTGLSLSSSGLLSGTPAAAGTIQFTAEVTDDQPQEDQQVYSFEINPAVQVQSLSLVDWTKGQNYPSTQMTASGGTGDLTWIDADSGLAGTGMILTSDGHLVGIPTMVDTITFMAQATDEAGSTDEKQMSLDVNPPVNITTTLVNTAKVGDPYNFQLTATGGTGGIVWSDNNGDLAGTGLALSTSGLISGTPTAEATVNMTARATDSTGSSDLQGLTLDITASCCQGTSVGNVDGSADFQVTLSDLSRLIDILFISLTPPDCLVEADVDLSGQPDPVVTDISLNDLTIMIDHLFVSLTPLPPCP